MSVIELGEVRTHRELAAANKQRLYDYCLRKWRFARDGITPPMVWFDPPEDPKQSIREAMRVLLEPINNSGEA